MKRKLFTACLLIAAAVISLFAVSLSADEESFENLYKNGPGVKDGYTVNGKISTAASYATSDYIAVEPGETINVGIVNPKQGIAVPLFEFYTPEKKFLSDVLPANVEYDRYSKTTAVGSTVVPEGAKFVKVNFERQYRDDLYITKGKGFTAMKCYEESGIVMPDINFDSPLYGKTILFVGDSICEAICEVTDKDHPEYNKTAGWAGKIGPHNDMEWENKGKGGASLSTIRGTNTIITQLKTMRAKAKTYDLVLLHGGVNDCWDSCKLGTIAEGFDGESFDQSTFAGGLEYTIWYTKQYYTNAKIGFLINPPVSLGNQASYWNLAKQICDKWEIPYLDLFTNKETQKIETSDGIHPTHNGYVALTPYIEAFCESLVPSPLSTLTPSTTEAAEETASSTETAAPAKTNTAPEETAPAVTETNEPEKNDNTAVIIAVAAGCLIIVALAVTFILLKKKK